MQKEKYQFLSTPKEIAEVMGLDVSNVRKTYIGKIDKKFNHTKSLDIGTWLIMNKVTSSELALAIRTIRATQEELMKGMKI